MKVLDLQCGLQHSFEGWFASEEDFQGQLSRGLVECPLCADKTITKMLSAPRLNFGATEPKAQPNSKTETKREPVVGVPPDAGVTAPEPELQAAWLNMVRHVVAHTEDVGNKFAEEARKIHYGESDQRGIRGRASREETEALLEEGISVLPLPIPAGLTGPLQ